MESEFIALDKYGEEAEWLRHFLEDISDWRKVVPPISIHCESQSTIRRARVTCIMRAKRRNGSRGAKEGQLRTDGGGVTVSVSLAGCLGDDGPPSR
ncbi:hypothetical protein TorRG33x02_336450 [Trema orientale]|uniref:Uncharacterized protein n=1 Tax=Trema orientale TaxID=63057 RepID=A0A2P5B039_TREOI|nr:hypothetical protein TorRG33x02_336450 [Trema orientale]